MTLTLLVKLFLGTLTTLQVSLIGVAIGTIGGICLGICTCQKTNWRIFKIYISVVRGTPLFVQLFLIYFALPQITGLAISPFVAGALSLGINSTAYVAEIIRGGINAIPEGQWDACVSLGYTATQTFSYIVLPQTFRNVLPSLVNEFIALIKESSVLMIIGVAELTKVSKDIVSRELRPFEIYLLTALIYFVITSSIAYIASKYEGE